MDLEAVIRLTYDDEVWQKCAIFGRCVQLWLAGELSDAAALLNVSKHMNYDSLIQAEMGGLLPGRDIETVTEMKTETETEDGTEQILKQKLKQKMKLKLKQKLNSVSY